MAESSAGTVGSTIGMSSFFALLAATRPLDRVAVPIRARAVAPAALASVLRARRRVVDAARPSEAPSPFVALRRLPLPL
jgi:hypothetical protein